MKVCYFCFDELVDGANDAIEGLYSEAAKRSVRRNGEIMKNYIVLL